MGSTVRTLNDRIRDTTRQVQQLGSAARAARADMQLGRSGAGAGQEPASVIAALTADLQRMVQP